MTKYKVQEIDPLKAVPSGLMREHITTEGSCIRLARCESCFEPFQSFGDEPETECPVCASNPGEKITKRYMDGKF